MSLRDELLEASLKALAEIETKVKAYVTADALRELLREAVAAGDFQTSCTVSSLMKLVPSMLLAKLEKAGRMAEVPIWLEAGVRAHGLDTERNGDLMRISWGKRESLLVETL